MTRYAPLLVALALAACGGSEDAATGFLTENPEKQPDGVSFDDDGRPYGYALLGERLPDFSAPLVGGGEVETIDLEGRWTVIDVWGIWCSDCQADAPYMAALASALQQDPDTGLLSIHTPSSSARADASMYGRYGSVDAYFDEKGYSYPTALDETGAIREALQIDWTPSYLLVAPDRTVRGFRTDLSVAGGEPVKDFIKDIARVKSEYAEAASLPQPARDLAFTDRGVLRLRGRVAFTQPALESALPGLTVRAATVDMNGEVFPYFEARSESGEEPVLSVFPTWDRGEAAVVSTTNAAVAGPLGEHVGDTRRGDLAPEALGDCEALERAGGGAAELCAVEGGPFARIFERAEGAPAADGVLTEMRFDPRRAGAAAER